MTASRIASQESKLLAATLDRLSSGVQDAAIVTGGATGAEELAEWYAQECGHAVKPIVADWERYGRGAKVIRAK